MSMSGEDLNDFTLEKLKIAQQLQDLRTEVAIAGERIKVLTERVDAQVAVMKVAVERHEHFLVGNGGPGMIVRMDRMEQWMGAIKWLWGLIIPLTLSQIYELVFKK